MFAALSTTPASLSSEADAVESVRILVVGNPGVTEEKREARGRMRFRAPLCALTLTLSPSLPSHRLRQVHARPRPGHGQAPLPAAAPDGRVHGVGQGE